MAMVIDPGSIASLATQIYLGGAVAKGAGREPEVWEDEETKIDPVAHAVEIAGRIVEASVIATPAINERIQRHIQQSGYGQSSVLVARPTPPGIR